MNATQIESLNKNHLKIVKNRINIKAKTDLNRVYINTLTPDFVYYNEKGKLVTKKNCFLL